MKLNLAIILSAAVFGLLPERSFSGSVYPEYLIPEPNDFSSSGMEGLRYSPSVTYSYSVGIGDGVLGYFSATSESAILDPTAAVSWAWNLKSLKKFSFLRFITYGVECTKAQLCHQIQGLNVSEFGYGIGIHMRDWNPYEMTIWANLGILRFNIDKNYLEANVEWVEHDFLEGVNHLQILEMLNDNFRPVPNGPEYLPVYVD